MGSVLADERTALDRGTEDLPEIQRRIAHRFRRVEVRARAGRYLAGLLARVERKHGWPLAEALGEADPHGVQRRLSGAMRDAEGVRDDLRASVVAHLGDAASGVLIVDEPGFLRQGTRPCSVARQYSGTAGTTANAQVGVFLTDASDRGAAFIERARSLPRAWTRDRERRATADIPQATRFATKITLAKRALARAFASGDGRSHAFRRWREKRGRGYVLMIPKTTAVRYQGRRERAEQLGARLSEGMWPQPVPQVKHRADDRPQWARLTLSDTCADGMCRAYGPADTVMQEQTSPTHRGSDALSLIERGMIPRQRVGNRCSTAAPAGQRPNR